jgi:hypothetical protein
MIVLDRSTTSAASEIAQELGLGRLQRMIDHAESAQEIRDEAVQESDRVTGLV